MSMEANKQYTPFTGQSSDSGHGAVGVGKAAGWISNETKKVRSWASAQTGS
jgi:hypothetical protein